MLKIKNPITFFIATWLLVLFLYFLHCSEILTVLKDKTVIYVGLSCCALTLSYLFVMILMPRFSGNSKYFVSLSLHNSLKIIFWIWCSLTIVEIVYFKSLPILALIGIGSGNYTEWGIPSLHGLLNAMIITLSNYYFYLYLQKKEKKYLWIFILCLCWPILLVTRQVFMSMSVQAALVYIIINKFKTSTVLKICVAAFIIIFLFGLVGDFRTGSKDSFINLAQPSSSYPSFLPSGFLWVYIYVTSPLSNVNFNIGIYPSFTFNPMYLVASFVPSFIRDKLISGTGQFNFRLVNEYLNVSSMFPNFLSAFGYFGSIISYFFLGLLFTFVYIKTKLRRVNIKWVFILAIILHNIMFSVFVDFFSSLVFLFQILLHFIVGTKIKTKSVEV